MVPTPERAVTARGGSAPPPAPPGAAPRAAAPPPGAFVPRSLRTPPAPGAASGGHPEVPTFHFPTFPPPHAFTGRAPPRPGAAPPLGERGREAADRRLLRRVFAATRLRAMRQVHGAAVVVAGPADAPDEDPGGIPNDAPDNAPNGAPDPTADALVTTRPGEAAAVKTADCVPLLLHDERTGAAAVVHAGWRGAAAGVVDRAVRALAETTGSPPASFHAAIGPAIGPCCFEVGPEVLAAFAEAGRNPEDIRRPPDTRRNPPRPHLDLPLDTRLRLLAAGLPESRIHESGRCTRCDPAFHSHRRSAAEAGRNWSVVLATSAALRPPSG